MKLNPFVFFALVFALSLGCKSGNQNNITVDFDSIDMNSDGMKVNSLDTLGEGLPIFYNMYLSVEMSTLFETAGAVFKPDLMNATENISGYITSSQQAVSLGVFAVDLSYARVFDQVEIAGRYFNAMQQISRELGIPDDYFENTANRFERNISDKDSLIKIANEVYQTTDNYLKENERYTTAAMIIVGGWLEAIYIAFDVAIESRDVEIIERLIDQKYSLNNLLIMLAEYRNNEVMAEYITELERIGTNYNALTIQFETNFDPLSPKGKEYMDQSIRQLEVLRASISRFRNLLTK